MEDGPVRIVSTPPRQPAAPRQRLPAPGLEELRRLEGELEQDWDRLQEQGQGYAAVRSRLADGKLDTEERTRWLRAVAEDQEAFLARLDDFLRRLHGHFIEQVLRELDHAMTTMSAFYGRRRLRAIDRRHRQLERLAARYRELESDYGTARDHGRIAVYQRFYAGVVSFSQRIRELDPTMPMSASPSWVERLYGLGRGLVWLSRRSGALVRLLVAGVQVLRVVLARKQPERGTPFTRRVDDLFRAWGDVRGFDVQVSGTEHLPSASSDGPVTLYTPAHRHGVTDNVTFSHLDRPDYLVFNAVDQLPLLPAFLKERVAHTNGLIAVGGGRGSSVDGALRALDRGLSRNILIYPEGSVSEGFRGTRPPRRNFGESLVRRIREAGHPLRIVPVSYLDNARFLDLAPRSGTNAGQRLRVVVGVPLEPSMVDALLQAGGGGLLNRMVRLAWLEGLVTDEHLLFGQDRVAAIEQRLDDDGIRYWGSLESAPVADRLSTSSEAPIRAREEPFRGKRVRVLRIPDDARGPDGRIVLPDLQRPDSSELLLGIREPAHIYLNVGRRRFDGDIFRYLKVKERDAVFPGILIRFRGVPVKSVNAIRRKLEEFAGREQRTLTCANSACRVIARAANIRIDDHADLRPFLPSHVLPTRTIRKLIERGVRNHAGDAVEIEIYKTDDRSLEEILSEARREEIRIARDHVEIFTRGAVRRLAAWFRALVRFAARVWRAPR
jgi:hypothetical protein